MSKGIKMNIGDFIEKSKSIHGDRYDYSKVNYINSTTKVEIICKEHGVFLQSPNKHLCKRGCPKCAGNFILTNDEVINRFRATHGDRYDYVKVKYKSIKGKVEIICKIHGIFEQRVDHHEGGQGCDKCRIDDLKITKYDFIEKLEKIFPEHFSHDFIYEDFQKEIVLECLITNKIIKIIPKRFLLLKYCPCCVENIKNEKILNKIEYLKNKPKGITDKLSHNEFLEKVKILHGDKYDYSDTVYIKHKEKINIRCKKEGHGIFSLTANHHLRGVGCPLCKESKGENKIRNFLTTNNVKFDIQKIFNNLNNGKSRSRFDFYLPEYNLCIEYDGKQHFKPIEKWGGEEELLTIKKRDEKKTQFCIDNNIKLLRIPYWEYDNIENILKEKLNIND